MNDHSTANTHVDVVAQLQARIKSLENEVRTFRDGENYIKQFEDAKQKCAVMYNPDEVFNRERLESWAEENGFVLSERLTWAAGIEDLLKPDQSAYGPYNADTVYSTSDAEVNRRVIEAERRGYARKLQEKEKPPQS